MKYGFILTAAFLVIGYNAATTAQTLSECEIVLMESIAQEDRNGKIEVASFRPATDFMNSIYDDEIDLIRKIDDLPIRAVMCKRENIVPSQNDFNVLATGIPFIISQDFDSHLSGLTTVYFKSGAFQHSYKGPVLDAKTQEEMIERMDMFNQQPHDLVQEEKAMAAQTEDDTASESRKNLPEE